jgi:hypothetical protein
MNDTIGTTLSQTLAQNYICEVVISTAKCLLLGAVGYVAAKLLDEHIIKKKK